jgi:hypothetical protein
MRFIICSVISFLVTGSGIDFLAPEAFAKGEPDSALFSKGLETFVVKDASGKTPTFRVLSATPSEKALALAVVTTLNLAPDTEKLPIKEYIDVKIEELNFQTVPEKVGDLKMIAKVSGRYLEIPKPVNRAQFLNGSTIELAFPLTQKNVALFDVKSDGKIKFRFDAAKNEVKIFEGTGHMNYAAPLLGSGEETIRFSGTATRLRL